MATRENLPIIKAARTGAAVAQLTLGSRYFFGRDGLPQSTGTAFYWLERAARQGLEEACVMIGRHVPYDLVTTMAQPHEAAPWYEKAFEAGVAKAGIVFARLVLDNLKQCSTTAKAKALSVLKAMADNNHHEAQWMLAQYLQRSTAGGKGHELVQRAAQAGVEEAQYCLARQAWAEADFDRYAALATVLADKLLLQHRAALAALLPLVPAAQAGPSIVLENEQITLLLNLADVLQRHAVAPLARVDQLLEMAALAGSPAARLTLGLRHARIDRKGERTFPQHGPANYRKAISWLLLAAGDGLAEAWHALSRIYAKSECSQRDLLSARRYLERAAELGLTAAQVEHAQTCWRNRRDAPINDIRAVYWWLQAAEDGHAQARQALVQFVRRPQRGAWAERILDQVTTKVRKANPFLCARLEVAAAFGLSRPEALLLDVRLGNHGHCLEVDISPYHAKSRRKLILVEHEEQREILKSAIRLYGDIDCGLSGPEGNYRQRQYRLRTLVDDPS